MFNRILILTLFFIAFTNLAFADVKKDCPGFADPVRIKVGNTEFHIPAIYHPILYNHYGNDKPVPKEQCRCYDLEKDQRGIAKSRRGYCQLEQDPAFEVDHITLNPSNFALATKKLEKQKMLIDYTQILVDFIQGHSYCSIKNKFDQIKDFSKSSEFIIKKENYETYYSFPVDHSLNSLIITCSKSYSENIGASNCSSHIAFSKDVRLIIKFNSNKVPLENWYSLFNEIEQFLKQITVNPPQNLSSSICETTPHQEP